MPVLEIVTFTASEAFIQDPLVHKKALVALSTADGFHSAHYGLQAEDGKAGYLLVVWETYEHHKNFTERSDYGDAIVELRRASEPGTAFSVEHVTFEGAYAPALTSSVTEIVHITPNPGQSEEAKVYVANLAAELEKTQGCYLPFYGTSKENVGNLVLVIGWDSVERHLEAVKTPALQEHIEGLRRTTEHGFKHTPLTKFTP